ncbi:T9SS type A sorting domain-containing protein [Flavobacterium psychrotolerans]|uniref:Secretion system C-terminal sorting domain-containing protein n=1 Tax=Flavobacterium psychrotolerans TaxID=2169410 RepID=A0A2U1JGJ8_9FLAO|nr:T9SS type A sorting domain-containing protein [Flavobacterium psychrotolerans]PWA04129.1 hypothetical protein DB895_12660 [Flavobacterium psychrotolerans]
MNTKPLLLLIFFSYLSNAQTPIDSYFGSDQAIYQIVNSSIPLDQTNSGANAVWNFDLFTNIGESDDNMTAPSATEIATYPNTTKKVTINSILFSTNSTNSISEIFSSSAANMVSITGMKNTDLELNYIKNNASLGTFPMTYGYSNTDTSAGTYIYGMYLGTFTGTITSSFDAYGTLTMNNTGNGSFSDGVSRLKTVQNISLNYGVLTNIGTVLQTTYNYYNTTNNGSNSLILRTITTSISVPSLGINQTTTQIERFSTMKLGINDMELQANQIQIIPNPIEDVLKIKTTLKIDAVRISDINGRVVLSSDYSQNYLDVSHLEKGVYFATIATDSGIITKRLLKK